MHNGERQQRELELRSVGRGGFHLFFQVEIHFFHHRQSGGVTVARHDCDQSGHRIFRLWRGGCGKGKTDGAHQQEDKAFFHVLLLSFDPFCRVSKRLPGEWKTFITLNVI